MLVHHLPATFLLLSIFLGWVTILTTVVLLTGWSILALQRPATSCCRISAYILQETIRRVVLRHLEQPQLGLLQDQPMNANTVVYRARSELFTPQTSREEGQRRPEGLPSPTRILPIANDPAVEDSNLVIVPTSPCPRLSRRRSVRSSRD